MYGPRQNNRNLSYSSTNQPSSSAYPFINAASSTGNASATYVLPGTTYSDPGSNTSSGCTNVVRSRNLEFSTTPSTSNSSATYVRRATIYPNLVEHRRNLAHHPSSRRNNERLEDSCSSDTCSEDSLPPSPRPFNRQATQKSVFEQPQQQQQCSRTDHPSPRDLIPSQVFPDSGNPVGVVKEQKTLTSQSRYEASTPVAGPPRARYYQRDATGMYSWSGDEAPREGKRRLRKLAPRSTRQAEIAANRAKESSSHRYQNPSEGRI
ncbi:hypothetical protein EAF04_003534 [Stromatinia cepivora]|nr:hypothetical protein EAF04_003534 [Stromatinia cepivora]